MDPQNILQLLQQRATETRSFADRLRDERAGKQSSIDKYQQTVGPQVTSYQSNGVPLAPSQVMGGTGALYGAYKDVLSPYSPELELKARGQESDILTQIYQLQQADQKASGKGVSISDKLKALELGYNIDDSGNLVKLDQDQADDEMVKTYADQIKAGTIKIGDVPSNKQGAVLKQLNTATGEIPETDETIAVKLIDDILAGKTAGLTGLAKGKLSLSGLFSPLETAASKTNVEQLVGILSLAAAGKLKGTGAISDAERELLRKAASNLGINEKGETVLSDAVFRKRLKEIQLTMAKKSGIPELIERVSGKKQGYDENSLLDEMIGPTTTSSATRR